MKIDHSLFKSAPQALRDVYGDCPKCNRQLVLKHANKSTFLSCSTYPSCDFTQSLNNTEVVTLKEMAGSSCPQCSSVLAVKKGRYGMFIGCTSFPTCTYIASKTNNKPVIGKIECPKCKSGELVERQNKFGKRFFACNAYPACKYMLNDKPVAEPCNKCGWPISVQKQINDDIVLVCPQSDCS